MNTIKNLIDCASEKIGYIESNILMEYVLGVDKSYLIINSDEVLDKDKVDKFNDYLESIKNGYPLQYITHKQEFMGLNFYVDEKVLIPQPDTEMLVEETINALNENTEKNNKKVETDSKIRVLDLCTGSGAIAISIANYINQRFTNKNEEAKGYFNFEIVASDISKGALEVAKKNYEELILDNNNENIKDNGNYIQDGQKETNINCKATIDFVQSDMFENIEGKFDIIVSNPPYIKSKEIMTLSKDVQNEPHIALDGGDDGLKFYKIIKNNLNRFLKEQGTVLLEIGYDQKEDMLRLFKGADCIKDLGGNDRVIIYKND